MYIIKNDLGQFLCEADPENESVAFSPMIFDALSWEKEDTANKLAEFLDNNIEGRTHTVSMIDDWGTIGSDPDNN